jgi:hypothetical protein
MSATVGSNNHRRDFLTLMPFCSACHNFRKEGYVMIKAVWLTPCAIKYKDDTEIISWRCDRGSLCESDCIYAVAREKFQKIPLGPTGASET